MAAIYGYKFGIEVIYTTTLYPLESTDSMEITASVDGGSMELIPYDSLSVDHALISASYTQTRWYFTYFAEDFLAMDHALISASYIQTRWYFTDAYEDSLSVDYALIDASYIPKLVMAATGSSGKPYEELQLSVTISNTCTMELI